MKMTKKLILASRSPRRQLLLRQIGLDFEVCESDIEEIFDYSKSPDVNAQTLSLEKANVVAAKIDNGIVIGADTIVVVDGKILGKPADAKEAVKMLMMLSGRTHKVYTGFSLVDCPTRRSVSKVAITDVTFRTLEEDEIAEYVRSGSPLDKAGAYGIQDDYGAVFVEKVNGCFYNVVGFPLMKFHLTFRKFLKQLRYH